MKKLRTLWQNVILWQRTNQSKTLKEMPTTYLFMQFGMSSFIATMLPTILVPATKVYFDAFSEGPVPWWWALVGLWVAGWWVMQMCAGLFSFTHARALGEQMFAPARKKTPYRFEVKPSRRTKKHR